MVDAVILIPTVCAALSLAAPCYLGLLRAAAEAYDGPPPLPAVLKFAGAASLIVGHSMLASAKPKLARGDKTYLAAASLLVVLFGGGCVKSLGYVSSAPSALLAGAAGLLFGVTFADMAAAATRATRLVLRLAISCGCCGASALIAVGATGGWAQGALAASVAFTCANSAVLVALHDAPFNSRVGQAFKLLGSSCLFTGNALGLGLHVEPPVGVVGGAVADALYGGAASTQLAVAAGGAVVAYFAAVFAAAPVKAKTA